MIKRWFSVAPIANGCNLKCDYCYLEHHIPSTRKTNNYKYPIKYMLQALSVERFGGSCMFNFCADGETLLAENIIEITKGLLYNGHYVSIVTNGTVTKIMNEYLSLNQNEKRRLVFKCSLHYKELKKKNLLNVYSKNVNALRNNGISITIEIVACDSILDDLDEIKDYCIRNFGALPHVLTGRSEHVEGKYLRFGSMLTDEEYYSIWKQFDSDLFEYQYHDFDKDCREYFCHAGEYTGIIHLENGNLIPCPGNNMLVTNIYENIEEQVKFAPVAYSCPFDSCFMGHVFNELGGDYIEDYDAGYRFWQFRDRKCIDGTSWLQPEIKDVYSHLCMELHESISQDKKIFLSAVMKVRYNGNVRINNIESFKQIVENGLISKGIKNVIIYGYGVLGKWLHNILRDTRINVICAIDKNAENIKGDLPIVKFYDGRKADAIIVSPYYLYTSIIPELRERSNGCVTMSLLEIV